MNRTIVLFTLLSLLVAPRLSTGQSSFEVLSTIPTGSAPFTASLHPDGRRLYVANMNSNTISVVDVQAMTSVGSISYGRGPFNLAVSPDGTRLVVCYIFSREIAIFDTATLSLVSSIPSLRVPNTIAFAAAGAYVVVTPGDQVVDVIDLTTGRVQAQIPMPEVSFYNQFIVTKDGSRAYLTAASGSPVDKVHVLDLLYGRLIASIAVEDEPVALALSPDERTLLVANSAANSLSVIDTASLSLSGRLGTASQPFQIQVDAKGEMAYVLSGAGAVDVVAMVSRAPVTRISVPGVTGGSPRNRMCITPMGRYLMVPAAGYDQVHLIELNPQSADRFKILRSATVAGMPTWLQVAPDGKRAFCIEYMGGSVAILSVPPEAVGRLNLRDSIVTVIGWCEDRIDAGGLDRTTLNNLQDAIDKLQGQNGGKGNDGALDKLDAGLILAALEKVKQAIVQLQAATGVDSTAQQQLLAMASRDLVRTLIDQKISYLGANDPKVVAAESDYAQGVQSLGVPDYVAAVEWFKKVSARF